ncbi:archaellin/type IV pilin N-terminal domain-containing protein [Halorubrum sp. SD626R]|uniref:archaellin/type IV pilin N-terminal domain-containing protein n=1 Tax=Halorubrum sp. SD626R TaxID=1419722 RepID=UPI000AD3B00D|nr:archaellin/type IV pilin N-terminal domain-containing protein [Halorubrum sp. SD626R]TKX81927.1 flagellin [Halorubrum sp. SD626R]
MFENILDEEERGQVGIGTLIVFIAMVLVAAIAAGVLINTAGFLQTQAEATGEEASSQVGDRIEVQSAAGVTISNQSVSEVNVTVSKSPGANNIDLEEVTYEAVTNSNVNQAVLNNSDISALTAESSGNNVITDQSDRYIITFDADADFGSDLGGGDRVTLTFTTASGASTVEELRVPDSLVDRSAVSL